MRDLVYPGSSFSNFYMRQLANRPMLLAALLVIPLWVIFSNFVVALAVSLLVAFLVAMIHSLRVLKKQERHEKQPGDSRPAP